MEEQSALDVNKWNARALELKKILAFWAKKEMHVLAYHTNAQNQQVKQMKQQQILNNHKEMRKN